ncbi:MAG: PD-(D/E)XK nuclease-like domain-containing protein [Desulfobacterales bacterium]|nr:MAG: PD-(D/E)XK nuclease-like domain-containing protein [Desulfobacterales bacterium]
MKKIKPKWIPDLPNNIYHWGKPYVDYLNTSKLKQLAISPAHCHAMQETPPTKALRVGSLFHDIVLLKSDEQQLRNAYKDDEVDLAVAMAESVLNHKKAASLIKHGYREQSGVFADPDLGFPCKIRADILIPDLGIIADLKSTRNAHPPSFKNDSKWLHYDWQGWWYLRGANAIEGKKIFHTFLIIACEKKPPYGVMLYKISQWRLDEAEQEIMPLLELYKNCSDKNRWPSYPEEIMEI